MKITQILEAQNNVSNNFSETEIKQETCDSSTSPLFTKIDIDKNLNHSVSCLCKCHGDLWSKDQEIIQVENCHIQLFQYTTDKEEALDSLTYQEDFSYYNDEDLPANEDEIPTNRDEMPANEDKMPIYGPW